MGDVIGEIKNCGKCQRKILVERVMCGVNHTIGIIITCWDCLPSEAIDKARKLYNIGEE